MPLQLRLHPGQLSDLAVIRDTSPELLTAIADRFLVATPRPMRPKDLHREITQVLGDNPKVAGQIMRPLLALQAIVRQRNLKVEEVVEAVRHGLETSEPRWEAEQLNKWKSAEPSFKQLLLSPVVRLVSTTLDLMYEYANLLQNTRIVTDIRPVFSEDADHIEGSVVSHTLRLRYDSTEGDHSISIAIDEDDIRELERQCKRALIKAQTARVLMEQKGMVPTVISGDGNNAEA